MKILIGLLFLAGIASAQVPGVAMACAGTPGNTAAANGVFCKDSTKAVWVCTNGSPACSVAADWASVGGAGLTIPSVTNVLKGNGSGGVSDTKITLTAPTTAWTITPAADNQTTVIPGGTLLANTRAVNTTSPLTGGGALSSDLTIAIPVATSSVNGYLASADWNTFNGKGSGSVTSAIIAGTANQIIASGTCTITTTGTCTLSLPSTVMITGATTTGPDFEVGLTGDTVNRVAIGLNTSDIARLSMGPGGASNRDLFLERLGAASLRFGAPDAASPVAQTISVQNVVAGTSNTAGATWTFAGSRGTGTGAGGPIIFQTAPAGSTGTSQNALVNTMTIDSVGAVPNTLYLSGGRVIIGSNSGPDGNLGLLIKSSSPIITTQATSASGNSTWNLYNSASAVVAQMQFNHTANNWTFNSAYPIGFGHNNTSSSLAGTMSVLDATASTGATSVNIGYDGSGTYTGAHTPALTTQFTLVDGQTQSTTPQLQGLGSTGAQGWFIKGSGAASFSGGAAILQSSGWWVLNNAIQLGGGPTTGIDLRNDYSFSWSSTTNSGSTNDTNLSRISAGKIGCGTGAQGSTGCTFDATLFQGGDAAPAATSCGTSPTVAAASSTFGGTFTEGSIATGCVITFASTPSRCVVTSESGLVFSYALSSNVLTVTNVGALSSTALDYTCTK